MNIFIYSFCYLSTKTVDKFVHKMLLMYFFSMFLFLIELFDSFLGKGFCHGLCHKCLINLNPERILLDYVRHITSNTGALYF